MVDISREKNYNYGEGEIMSIFNKYTIPYYKK